MTAPPPTKTEESLTTQRRYDRQAAPYDLMEIPLGDKMAKNALWGWLMAGPRVRRAQRSALSSG